MQEAGLFDSYHDDDLDSDVSSVGTLAEELAAEFLDGEELSGELEFQDYHEDFIDDSNHHHDVTGDDDILAFVPRLATPEIHNLMRGRHANLEESIARQMVEDSYFDEFYWLKNKFLPAACFFAKGIHEEEHFNVVWNAVYKDGRFHKRGKEFSFAEYRDDKRELRRLIDSYIKKFFTKTPWLVKATRNYLLEHGTYSPRNAQEHLESLWERFYKTWDDLTVKQRNAIELIYTGDETISYQAAADQLQISKDSFQDRVRRAVKKFKDAFPEFAHLKYSDTNPNAAPDKLYNGFYWKSDARLKHPLFQIDAHLGYMVCIKPPKRAARDDHDVGYLASVDAESKVHSTLPDILDTEYFTGLYPENYFARLNGRSVFKGGGLIAQKQHIQRGLGVESIVHDR